MRGLGPPGDIPTIDGVGVTELEAFRVSYMADVIDVKLRLSSEKSVDTCHKVSRDDFLRILFFSLGGLFIVVVKREDIILRDVLSLL